MKNGFSLIELVVAILVVGILTAIAIPSYTSYSHRVKRSDAVRTMTIDAQALERCYSQSQAFTYTGCTQITTPAPSAQGYYTVVVTVPPAGTSYTITATPANPGPQTSDNTCQTFTLNNLGTQGALDNSSNNTTQTCWGST